MGEWTTGELNNAKSVWCSLNIAYNARECCPGPVLPQSTAAEPLLPPSRTVTFSGKVKHKRALATTFGCELRKMVMLGPFWLRASSLLPQGQLFLATISSNPNYSRTRWHWNTAWLPAEEFPFQHKTQSLRRAVCWWTLSTALPSADGPRVSNEMRFFLLLSSEDPFPPGPSLVGQ